jgi:hypothetical protein
MANQALIDYIMHQRVHGASPANIKNALLHAGWDEGDIEKGLKATAMALDLPPPPPQVVIKPDQSGGTVAQGTEATAPVAKKPPLLAIAILIISILVVAAAAVFLYMQYLRPQAVPTKETTPKGATTRSAPVAQPSASETIATPPNSEGGLVQQEPVATDTTMLP